MSVYVMVSAGFPNVTDDAQRDKIYKCLEEKRNEEGYRDILRRE